MNAKPITRRHRLIEEMLLTIIATCGTTKVNYTASPGQRYARRSPIPAGWGGYVVDYETLAKLQKLRRPLKEAAGSIGFMEISNGNIIINSARRLA